MPQKVGMSLRRLEQKELEAEKGRTIVGGRQSMSTDRELKNMEPERPDSRQESTLDRREVVRNGKEKLEGYTKHRQRDGANS